MVFKCLIPFPIPQISVLEIMIANNNAIPHLICPPLIVTIQETVLIIDVRYASLYDPAG